MYDAVRDESGIIVNLASKEYAKCIEKYLTEDDLFLNITFCEEVRGKLVIKGNVRQDGARRNGTFYGRESHRAVGRDPEFDRLGYRFREDLSGETEYVFERVE